MAATFSQPSRLYAAGVYGPFAVDSLVSSDTDFLLATFTVEGWPTASPLMVVEVFWDSGDGGTFNVASPPRDNRGNPVSVVRLKVGIPQTGDGKAAVSSGTMRVTLMQAARTAITLSPGSNTAA